MTLECFQDLNNVRGKKDALEEQLSYQTDAESIQWIIHRQVAETVQSDAIVFEEFDNTAAMDKVQRYATPI